MANDLTLPARAVEHRTWPPSAIHLFPDTHTTQAGLHTLLAGIRARCEGAEEGSCHLRIGASGALSAEPRAGGILPSDGDPGDFATAVPFAAVNRYLPVRPGVRVVVTLGTRRPPPTSRATGRAGWRSSRGNCPSSATWPLRRRSGSCGGARPPGAGC